MPCHSLMENVREEFEKPAVTLVTGTTAKLSVTIPSEVRPGMSNKTTTNCDKAVEFRISNFDKGRPYAAYLKLTVH